LITALEGAQRWGREWERRRGSNWPRDVFPSHSGGEATNLKQKPLAPFCILWEKPPCSRNMPPCYL